MQHAIDARHRPHDQFPQHHRRPWRTALAALAVLALAMPVSAATAEETTSAAAYAARPAGYAVVSTGAEVIASTGTEFNMGEGPGSNMTDGDLATKSGGVGQLDFVIDLGRTLPIGHIEIEFDRLWDGPNVISTSDDGATWAELVSASGLDYIEDDTAAPEGANTFGYLAPANTSARYLRVSAREWANIFEVSVSSDFAYTAPPSGAINVALGAPVTAVAPADFNMGEGPGGNMTDGNPATRAGGLPLLDFMVDLGRTVSIDYLNVDFHRLWSGQNRLWVSDDAATWTPVFLATGEQYMLHTGIDALDPNVLGATVPGSPEARYVRFASGDWTNVNEFAIYTTDTIPVEILELEGPDKVVVGMPSRWSTWITPQSAAAAPLVWSVAPATTNGGAATIDAQTGILTGAAAGDVIVTATVDDGTALAATALVTVTHTADTWRSIELALDSSVVYTDPLLDVDVTATFEGPGGAEIVRQGFWDGGSTWRVRFAAPTAGEWTVSVSSTDPSNTGLSLAALDFDVSEYDGPLAVYQRGFPTVSGDGRHFEYADGTPFLYLGDTHWLMLEEEWDSSNVEGVPSQFKYAVDRRVSQGFTVYQSQPLSMNIPGINVSGGVNDSVIAQLRDVDRKFEYVADAGLAHSNAFWRYVDNLDVTDPTLLAELGVYWQARYGAYPVFWTTAQEVDPQFHSNDPQYWKVLAGALSDADAYDHPLTAHTFLQSGTFVSGWGDLPFHDWFGIQTSGGDRGIYQSAWERPVAKPVITYESGYEFNVTTTADARRTAYRSFLNGAFGYGYGVQGVWATNQSPDYWFPYGPYYRWFDGLNAPGGEQMEHLGNFLDTVGWWTLEPAFDGTERSDFGGDALVPLSTADDDTYVVYVQSGTSGSVGTLRGLTDGPYAAWWFNPRTGAYTLIDDELAVVAGEWAVPAAPTTNDWVLLVANDELDAVSSLYVEAAGNATTIFEAGGTLQLSALVRGEVQSGVTWSISAADGSPTTAATVSATGLVTAVEDGIVLVCASSASHGDACRTVNLLRQETTTPLETIQSISLSHAGGRNFVAHITPATTHDQRLTWTVTEPDGTPTTKAAISETGMMSMFQEGSVRVTATSRDGSNVSGTMLYDIVFDDVITNPLLAGAVASASSSDYGNDYRPQKALTSNHGDWGGWTSSLPGTVSFETPEWLQVDLPEARTFTSMDVYSTGNGYQLRSYDLEAWVGGAWTTLGQVRGATSASTSLTFAPVTTERFRVVAFVGDSMAIARISAVEPGYDPLAAAPPAAVTAPAVTGQPVVGGTLTATAGTWNPHGSTVAIAWLRDGAPIAGATGATYVLVGEDAGAHVQAAVTATANGLSATSVSEAVVVAHDVALSIRLSSALATNRWPVTATVTATSSGDLEGRTVTVRYGTRSLTAVLDGAGRAVVTLPRTGWGFIGVRAVLVESAELRGATSGTSYYLSVPI